MPTHKNIVSKEYIKFLNEIKSCIITARIQAVLSVNKVFLQQLVAEIPFAEQADEAIKSAYN